MATSKASSRALVVTVAVFFASACLPTDTRPPPGKLLVTLSPDDLLTSAVTSDDGWTISYDRFLVSLGHVSADGDACTGYSDPDYSRVFDMRRPEPQKVSLLYAFGHCDFDFELSSPHADSVLGEGTTEADKTFLRTPGDTPPYATASGISIYAAGSATKAGVRKTFAWPFRQRIDYESCDSVVNGEVVQGFDIAQDESKTLDLLARGRALFEDSFDLEKARVRFQPFADADAATGNGDGEVTLDELTPSHLAGLGSPQSLADAGSDGGTRGVDAGELGIRDAGPHVGVAADWTNLADFLYREAFPRVVRFQGNGTCAMDVFPNDVVRR